MPLWASALMASRSVPRETPERGHQLRFGRDALLQRPLARVDHVPELGGDFVRQRRPVRGSERHAVSFDGVPSCAVPSGECRLGPGVRVRESGPQLLRSRRQEVATTIWARAMPAGGQRQRPAVRGAVQQAHAERARRSPAGSPADWARVDSAVVSAVVRPLRLIITMTSGKMPRPKPSSTAVSGAQGSRQDQHGAATPAAMVTVAR